MTSSKQQLLDLALERERAVPLRAAEGVDLRQDPAGVVRHDLELGAVPRDVEEGVEVLVHRGLGQDPQGLLVAQALGHGEVVRQVLGGAVCGGGHGVLVPVSSSKAAACTS